VRLRVGVPETSRSGIDETRAGVLETGRRAKPFGSVPLARALAFSAARARNRAWTRRRSPPGRASSAARRCPRPSSSPAAAPPPRSRPAPRSAGDARLCSGSPRRSAPRRRRTATRARSGSRRAVDRRARHRAGPVDPQKLIEPRASDHELSAGLQYDRAAEPFLDSQPTKHGRPGHRLLPGGLIHRRDVARVRHGEASSPSNSSPWLQEFH
jgi:hypothetical protein